MNFQLKLALFLFLPHTCVFVKVQASTDDAFNASCLFSELMYSGFDSVEEEKEGPVEEEGFSLTFVEKMKIIVDNHPI